MKLAFHDRSVRNITFFSIGKTVSLLGSSAYAFAMGLHILGLTGSTLSFAATLVLGLLPVVVIGPFAGVLADRADRKLVAVSADIAGAVFLGLLLLAVAGKDIPLAAIYTSTFILNVMAVFYDTAMEAGIPDVVKAERLTDINSAGKAIEAAASVSGPVLGGLAYALVDIRLFMALNALSFLFSGFTVLMMDFRVNARSSDAAPQKPGISFFRDIRDAALYMKGERGIARVFIYLLFLNLFTGFSLLVPLPYILNNVLGLDPDVLGIVQGSIPAGAAAGAVLVRKNRHSPDLLKRLPAMSCVLAVCIMLTAVPTLAVDVFRSDALLLLCYCPVMAILGITISFIDIPLLSMLQLKLPEECRGRVLSLGMSLVKIASPLAFLASGWSLRLLPPFVIVFSGGICLLLLARAYR